MADEDARVYTDERRRLLHELDVERSQLWRNIEWCRIRDIENPFIGEWSLKDIVGHIASWEAEVVTAFREIREGKRPTLYGFDAEALDAWNHDHVERKRDLDFWNVLTQLRAGRQRLLEEIALVSDEDLVSEGSRRERLVRSIIDHDRHHWHDIAARLAGMAGARHEAGPASVPAEATPGA
jgi:uncharacterized damage-inducible protein DinB